MTSQLQWQFLDGTKIMVQLNYEVLQQKYRLRFYFLVTTPGKISPLTVTTFFRNYFMSTIFLGVCSEDFIWESTNVTHLEGSLKLSEDAQTGLELPTPNVALAPAGGEQDPSKEPLDIDPLNRLRVSFVRYNQNTPISFFVYGIRANLDTTKMAAALLKMTQEEIAIEIEGDEQDTREVGLRFAGLTSPYQVTENQFVISVSCKKQPLPKKQAYN